MPVAAMVTLGKSILHNIGVALVGLAIAFVGTRIDRRFGLSEFRSGAAIIGGMLLGAGFLLRLWATFHFYGHGMRVIALAPQPTLLTSGPYCFSRNPLYLGGNLFIFLGAAFVFGSPAASLFTVLHLPFLDLFVVRREEKQLEQQFGDDRRRYRNRVNRWLQPRPHGGCKLR
jgi:protein-S-isoprenylcysteine O-methyltransferase Ste14